MHECTDVSIDLMQKDDFGLYIMVVGATDRAASRLVEVH